jgi:hypothetical protein
VIKKLPSILLPLLAAGALAQDIELQAEQVQVRRYTVEMMIFAYEQSLSGGSEIFLPDEPPPFEYGVDQDLIDFIFGDGMLPAEFAKRDEPELTEVELILHERQVDPDDPYAFIILPEEDFVLLDIVASLDELDAYIPLMHFGWTQPALPDEEPEVRSLSSFATPPEGLEGDLSLYLGRYLHLAVNLQLDSTTLEKMADSEVAEDRADRYDFGDDINEFGFYDMGDDQVATYPIRYRIEENRIVRNGELRYYDHPRFGVLAKITRVEEPEPEEIEEELLGYDGE